MIVSSGLSSSLLIFFGLISISLINWVNLLYFSILEFSVTWLNAFISNIISYLFQSICLISRVPEGYLLLYLLLLAYVCLVSSCASFLFYFLTGVEFEDLFVRVTWGAGYCCLVPEKISVCFCWALLGTGRPKQTLEVLQVTSRVNYPHTPKYSPSGFQPRGGDGSLAAHPPQAPDSTSCPRSLRSTALPLGHFFLIRKPQSLFRFYFCCSSNYNYYSTQFKQSLQFLLASRTFFWPILFLNPF